MIFSKTLIAGFMMAASSSVFASGDNIHLEANQGKEIQFSVESNPSTGYGWMIKSLPKELIFVSSGYTQSEDCKDGAVGCSGIETLTFIAQKRGKGELKLINGRVFDKASWKEKTISVNIK